MGSRSPSFSVFPLLLSLLLLCLYSQVKGLRQGEGDGRRIVKPVIGFSPFSTALETLQKQIGYNFQDIGLLRRAMTHASFSEENSKALAILGANVIDTSVSLRSLAKDIDISSKDLSHRIADISKVETSCAIDGSRLGLHKVVRVSPKTNSSNPVVVCGAFRAMFGAIAIDTGKADDAEGVFWKIHGGEFGKALAL